MRFYTIYEHPADFPEGYVVRAWDIRPHGVMRPLEARRTLTLDGARDLVPPGLWCVPRSPGDDRTIVETWM